MDIIFQISYQHNRTPHFMCFNEEEKHLLIYSLSSHKFQLLNLNSRQLSSINYSTDESILNIGYSIIYHLYYYTTRETNRFVLFRLNEEEKQIEINREIELINSKDHFINVHIYENFIFFLYLTPSSIVMFGKYDIENSSIVLSIRLDNKFYENGQKNHYKIIDFTINNPFLCLLIQFKNKSKSKILIYDYETITKTDSFDLIDAVNPKSIISTKK